MTWWERSVFYEIYVRSFQDSNGDGIGDLNGIGARLPYLADLGVDAIWITPFYPSPQVDFGYDVSDYEEVDPAFGTLADFDRLIEAARSRGIRIVVDLVLNHTSDEHRWFRESRGSRSSSHRDWYIWRDGKDGGPPNNWESTFGGPAWTLDPGTGQWYYHFFYPQQPDLNWRNPEVEQRMFDVAKFWIDRGGAGFRLDAVNALFEDPALRDNPVLPKPLVGLTGVDTQEFRYTRALPEIHDPLRRLRSFVDAYRPGTLLISEAYVETLADLVAFHGDPGGRDEMQLPFNFFLAQAESRQAPHLREIVEAIEHAYGDRWPSLVLSNHDIERACDRFRAGADVDRVAKLLGALLLTLRGTPFLYYGEEIAMRSDPPLHLDEVRDPVGRTFWPRYKGRDAERRPMSWDGSAESGFSTARPWLRLPFDSAERTVERQRRDPGSVLNFYRTLLRLRRESPALQAGRYRSAGTDPAIFAFVRESHRETVLVVINTADEPIEWNDPGGAGSWQLDPLEVVIVRTTDAGTTELRSR